MHCLQVNDALSQTWIIDSGASFHVTPNNHACSIEGIDNVHRSVDGKNELVLHNVRYVPGIKKSLLSMGRMDMQAYSMLFEKGMWKMTKGSRLIVDCKRDKEGDSILLAWYCLIWQIHCFA